VVDGEPHEIDLLLQVTVSLATPAPSLSGDPSGDKPFFGPPVLLAAAVFVVLLLLLSLIFNAFSG
jgi:hypothetical protein